MQLTPHLWRAADLVKLFEPFEPHAVRRADGGWAIGYGHTRTAREGARVSRSDGGALLIYDLIQAAAMIEREVHVPLTGDQSAALTAFALNIGDDAFAQSGVVERLNGGDRPGVAREMVRWGRADLAGAFQLRPGLGATVPDNDEALPPPVMETPAAAAFKPPPAANEGEPAVAAIAPAKAGRHLAWSRRRLVATALGALGLILFAVSAAMILSGQLGAVDLVVGLIGALLTIPATYTLLGRRGRA